MEESIEEEPGPYEKQAVVDVHNYQKSCVGGQFHDKVISVKKLILTIVYNDKTLLESLHYKHLRLT